MSGDDGGIFGLEAEGGVEKIKFREFDRAVHLVIDSH